VRAVAVIDGEHYASVVRDAFVELPHEIVPASRRRHREAGVAANSTGGARASLEDAIRDTRPMWYSISPTSPYFGRLRDSLAARALALGVPYEGRLQARPAAFRDRSDAVRGRDRHRQVGKTAVTGHVARRMARDRRVVVVAMGRGGPADPEVIEVQPTVRPPGALRAGRHAASDHLETAALTGLPTVGCRRCGGGSPGRSDSNVLAGTRIAEELGPDLMVLDGSGAALPSIAASAGSLWSGRTRICGRNRLSEPVSALLADLVVVRWPRTVSITRAFGQLSS
jgi:cyclic 2,3-diphosphoglycerate synthetase